MTKEHFTRQVLPLQNKLYRYALSIVFEEALAQDIVQEVFLKLWNQRAKLQKVKNIEAWSIRMTRNLSYDKLKASSRKMDDIETVAISFVANSFPGKATEHADLIAAIKDIMQNLPEKQKEIFRLRELLGYSNAEIEELLSLDRNQVKVNLFRARQKIKSKLLQLINYGLEE